MKFTEENIIRYLDGELSSAERQLVEDEIKINSSFSELLKHHDTIHSTLNEGTLKSPSQNFLSEVMSSVRTSSFAESKFFNRTRIIVLSIIFVAVATSLYYLSMKFYPTLGGTLSNEINLKDVTLNLQPAQKILDSDILFKVVFYVNGLVSLLLLDRAILKPYFARRKQRYSM